ncbi:MAG: hypothetical protein JWR38_5701 [Mucilaginibacter sp.]|nr:hypothetical protein [Mucilaginibacter sp.]
MKKIIYLSACLFALVASGCKKNEIKQLGGPATGALIKFIHVAPGTPGLDGYINDTKVTPATIASVTDNLAPTSITTGYTYNNVFPGSNYAVTTAGNTVIKVVAATNVPALISAQTAAPGAVIGTVTQATTNGAAYSVFAVGLPGSTTTPLTVKVVQDNFPTAAAGKAYVRFANFIPNGPALDLGGTYTPTGGASTTVSVSTGIAYGALSDFIAVDVNPLSTTSYVFQASSTGTTTKVGTVSSAASLAPGRYYTLIASGLYADYAVPGTSITLKATARPKLPTTDPVTRYPEIYFNVPGLIYYTNK